MNEQPTPILQTVPLGFQWATVDPFLFCVHHLDHYRCYCYQSQHP